MLQKIIDANRLFKILREKLVANSNYSSSLDQRIFEFINGYLKFHQLDESEVANDYKKYIKAYNKDARHYLKTGLYPLEADPQRKSLERIPYNIVLLLSTILTPHRFRIMQMIDDIKPSEGKALFIGCGPGLEIQLCIDKYEHIVAYDLTVDEHLGNTFKDKVEIRNEYFEGNLTEQFEAVYLIEILEHLDQPYKLLKDCGSVLKEGGSIYLTTAVNMPQFDHLYKFEADHVDFEKQIKELGFEVQYSEEVFHAAMTLELNSFNKYYHIIKTQTKQNMNTQNMDELLPNKPLHDTIEYPWVKCYVAFMRKSVKRNLMKRDYVYSTKNARLLKDAWETIEPLTLLDPFRLGALIDSLYKIKDLEGDIVECGSYKGGSGILMALLIKELGLNKKIHLMDSFDGLPDPHAEHDKGYKRGQFLSNYDQLKHQVETLGLTDIITLHKGWFNETIPVLLKEKPDLKIAVFHIDCDLYTSTMDCFPQLYDHVVEGGAVILDDYNDGGGGEKKAINQVLYERKQPQVYRLGYGPQVFFYKNDLSTESKYTVADGEMKYDVSMIHQNDAYIDWLKENTNEDFRQKLNSIL